MALTCRDAFATCGRSSFSYAKKAARIGSRPQPTARGSKHSWKSLEIGPHVFIWMTEPLISLSFHQFPANPLAGIIFGRTNLSLCASHADPFLALICLSGCVLPEPPKSHEWACASSWYVEFHSALVLLHDVAGSSRFSKHLIQKRMISAVLGGQDSKLKAFVSIWLSAMAACVCNHESAVLILSPSIIAACVVLHRFTVSCLCDPCASKCYIETQRSNVWVVLWKKYTTQTKTG